MIANRANLDALFQTFLTAFNAAQEEQRRRVTPNQLMLEDFAMSVRSAGAATTHAWMNQVPSMKEWIGPRLVKDITGDKLVVVNRDFEDTVGISRNDVEDDQYGTFTPLVSALGKASEEIWMQLAMAALLDNPGWADGNPFFCAGRVLSAESGAMTNAVTTALSAAAVEAGLAAMMSWQLHGGRDAGVMPRMLIVGPGNLSLAKKIVEADMVADGGVSVSNVSTARMLQVRFDSGLVGSNAQKWFITGEKYGIRPVAVQKRREASLTRKDRDTDDNVFNENKYLYGADARGEGFLTMPFLAYAGGMAAVPAWSDPEAEEEG